MRFDSLSRFLALGLLPLTAALPSDAPLFHGAWKLDTRQSDIRPMPEPPCEVLTIQHRDGKLISTGVFPPCPEAHPALFTQERKETRAVSGGTERRTLVKWEGEALLVNTIVNGKNSTNYTRMDRWRQSRDGGTLRIRRQIVSLRGETESELVYTRQKQ